VDQLGGDVLEAERVSNAAADVAQDLVRDRLGGEARRHVEELFECEPVAGRLGGLLRGLHASAAWSATETSTSSSSSVARLRLSGSSTERTPSRWPSEWRIGRKSASSGCQPSGSPARVPLGHVAVARCLPVVAPRRDDVGPSPQEPVADQRVPLGDGADLAGQGLLHCDVPVHGRDREVIPCRPVDVHHDGLIAERFGDGPRDRTEEVGKILLGSHEAADLEQSL
jgi:hypothetical protein